MPRPRKTDKKIASFPAVTVRLEPNYQRTRVVWTVRCDDGTFATGLAVSRLQGLQKAYAVIDAVPKASAETGVKLVVNNPDGPTSQD